VPQIRDARVIDRLGRLAARPSGLLPCAILAFALALFLLPLAFGYTLTHFSDIYVLSPTYILRPPDWFHSRAIDPSPIFLFIPSDLLNRQLVRALELFSWNPYVGFGTPELGAMQSAPYFPGKLISLLWPDYFRGRDVMLAALLLTAGAGNYLLLRSMGVGRAGATFSGLAYMLCQRLFLIINMPAFMIECLLPVMLYAIHEMVRRKSVGFSLFAGVVGGSQFLGGFPEASFIFTLVSGAFFLWLAVCDYRQQGDWRCLALLGLLTAFVTLALSAFQLAEFARLVFAAHTVHTTSYGAVVKEPYWLLPLFISNFFGTPFYENWLSVVSPNDHMSLSIFCGTSTLILGLTALLWRTSPMRGAIWFFAAVFFVFLGYDFGIPVLRSIGQLPLFNLMSIAWNVFAIPFALSVLAGFGVQSLLHPGAGGRVAAAFTIFAVLLFALTMLLPAPILSWDPFLPLAYVLPLLAAAILLVRRPRWSQAGVVSLFALITLESYLCVKELGYLHYFGPRPMELPSAKWLASNVGHERMFGLESIYPANTLSPSRVRDIRHFDAMYSPLYIDYAEAIWPGARNTLVQYGSPELKIAQDPLLDLAAIKFVIAPRPLAPMPANFTQVYSNLDGTIYRNEQAFARARVVENAIAAPTSLNPPMLKGMIGELRNAVVLEGYSGGAKRDGCSAAGMSTVEYLADDASQVRLKVSAPCGGFLVLADLFYPGWEASVDGTSTQIYKANYAFRAVAVEAGTHEIVFAYRPWSLRLGVPLALLTAFGLLIFFSARAFRSVRSLTRRAVPAA
jgi:hypothetical protein